MTGFVSGSSSNSHWRGSAAEDHRYSGLVDQRRGIVTAMVEGNQHHLCLTLGALAELEERLGGGSLYDLGKNWDSGTLTAREVIAVFSAGLRGGGYDVSDDDVARMYVEGGLFRVTKVVEQLLEVTFPKL